MKRFLQLTLVAVAIALLILPANAYAGSSGAIRAFDDEEVVGLDYSNKTLQRGEFYSVQLDDSNFSNSDLRGTVFNNVSMNNANFHGVNFTYGIAYLTDFTDADLSDAIMAETMMLNSRFTRADITGTDFTEAIIDPLEVKKLCTYASGVNSQTGVDTRDSLGCY